MRLAILRASGPKLEPVAFLQAHGLHTDSIWPTGGQFAGRSRAEAGFNLAVADASSGQELAMQISVWLAARQRTLVTATSDTPPDLAAAPW
jgi:hypothetical protein